MRIPWIAHRTNTSILNERHLPMNWLYDFFKASKTWPRHSTKWFREDNLYNARNGRMKRSRGKPRQRWEKDITDIFGTMATASRGVRTGIDFAMLFGQPEEDMLSEKEVLHSNLYKH